MVEVDGLPALRQIVKVRNPQQDTGQVFLGSLLFPRAGHSAVLKVQCVKRGTTGVRESVVRADVGPGAFFTPSPFAPDLDLSKPGALPNDVADEAGWDDRFPDYPLTRARIALGRLRSAVTVDPRFRELPPFE